MLEEGEQLLERLIAINREGTPIIVEGKNDEKALRALGIEGEVIRLKGENKTLSAIAEEAAPKRKLIIMTDPDREGSKLAFQFSRLLENYGAHPDLRFRRITRLFGRNAVEELKETSSG